MQKIEGSPKTLKELLMNNKYSIHYYQREYRWQSKHIEELLDDLISEFLVYYKDGDQRTAIDEYGGYFMGSIVVTGRENAIIDGQQRLSSLTLLLIFLNNKIKEYGLVHEEIVGMIYSTSRGIKSFNLNVEDRATCMEALFNGYNFDCSNVNESVKNLYNRYNDIKTFFSEDIKKDNILNFCDWLIEKVFFIEIVATTEQDAHKIFVSMNDRGLSLTPSEMLKGYILSEVRDDSLRENLNELWKEKILKLKTLDEKGDEVFIKNWLRAQYAETIREAKAGSENKDFDIIGGPFHKWVRDERDKLNLINCEDYKMFVNKFAKFADIYEVIKDAEINFHSELNYIYYNAQLNFTLQSQLLLAPIYYEDNMDVVKQKMNLVARYIDLFIAYRIPYYKSVDYSSIKNYVFNITRLIRNSSIDELKFKLKQSINEYQYQPVDKVFNEFELNSYNKKYIKNFLARITGYIEEQCDVVSNYCNYVNTQVSNPYEIEHILADHFERFTNEYVDQADFKIWRNKLGNLLLLHKSINASINDDSYSNKLSTYCSNEGNIYSESLGNQAYSHNPRFIRFKNENNLEFKPYESFGKKEIAERTNLFVQLFKLVWNDKMFE